MVVGAGHKKADDHVRKRQPDLAIAIGAGMRKRIEQTPSEKGDEARSSRPPAVVVEHLDASPAGSLSRGGRRAVHQDGKAWTDESHMACAVIDRAQR